MGSIDRARALLLVAAARWDTGNHWLDQAAPGPYDDAEMEIRDDELLKAARAFVEAYA